MRYRVTPKNKMKVSRALERSARLNRKALGLSGLPWNSNAEAPHNVLMKIVEALTHSAREHMVAVRPPRLGDPGADENFRELRKDDFMLLMGCEQVLQLAHQVQQALDGENAAAAALAALRLGQLAVTLKLRDMPRYAALGKNVSKGRTRKLPRNEIVAFYQGYKRQHPAQDSYRATARHFKCSISSVKRFVRSHQSSS